jgi:hypothetical protein
VQCYDAQNNALRLPEDIAIEVLSAVLPILETVPKG